MRSMLNQRGARVVVIIIIIFVIIAIGGIYEPKKHINRKYTGYVLNERSEAVKTVQVVFEGVYNRKLDQFNGEIRIDQLELKNIVAKNKGRVFTLSDNRGDYHEYGNITYTKSFDSIDFQLNDLKIIRSLLKDMKWDEVVLIKLLEEEEL